MWILWDQFDREVRTGLACCSLAAVVAAAAFYVRYGIAGAIVGDLRGHAPAVGLTAAGEQARSWSA